MLTSDNRKSNAANTPPRTAREHPVRTLQAAILLATIVSAGSAAAAETIGEQACRQCHAEQSARWAGSHHDRAMQEATPDTVLGDFDDATFEHFGVVSRFFRKSGQFMVRTDGADGQMHDFPVRYTFGVDPLQQYLVEFPDGRLQALDIAWDSRSRKAGGQRWFHLHPQEKITHDHPLHWTGPNLNWNYMCADCHSTGLKKNLDPERRTYQTRWAEIDVACEACHGPGSEHKRWAQSPPAERSTTANMGLTVTLGERRGISWIIDETTGKPHRSQPNRSRSEIQVCARCHSRRSQLNDRFTPGGSLLDSYRPVLLSEGLYFADGQMQDEVYVWGSFRQSRMYDAGVTCSDCHDPHAAGKHKPDASVCSQCHAPTRYARPEHHFHPAGSAGADCIECHMPATTFMGVDRRHDHSFRIPRPDWSVTLATPNACNNCHSEQSAEWAARMIKQWYGAQPVGFQRFAPALAAAREGRPAAREPLLALAQDSRAPSIARTTALAEIAPVTDRQTLMVIQQGLNDPDPLLRLGALSALEPAPLEHRILALPLVWDDRLAVRIEAARLLAGYPRQRLQPAQAEVLEKVLREYIETQRFSAERPESQLNLANLYIDLGQYRQAESAYRTALALQPRFVPAYVNLAQRLADSGREQEAAQLLEAGIGQVPDNATLHHALGLSLVRQKQLKAALRSLARASELAPDESRYAYVYAVALHSSGDLEQALRVLENNHARHPTDPDTLFALATFNRDAGDRLNAARYARELLALMPGNPDIERLVRELEAE